MPGDLISRRPLIFTFLVLGGFFVLALAAKAVMVGAGLSDFTVNLAGQAVIAGYVAALLQGLGWWRECGFSTKVTPKAFLAFAPWLLVPMIQATDIGRLEVGPGRIAAFALVLTGCYALYGIWLIRRAARRSISTPHLT